LPFVPALLSSLHIASTTDDALSSSTRCSIPAEHGGQPRASVVSGSFFFHSPSRTGGPATLALSIVFAREPPRGLTQTCASWTAALRCHGAERCRPGCSSPDLAGPVRSYRHDPGWKDGVCATAQHRASKRAEMCSLENPLQSRIRGVGARRPQSSAVTLQSPRRALGNGLCDSSFSSLCGGPGATHQEQVNDLTERARRPARGRTHW